MNLLTSGVGAAVRNLSTEKVFHSPNRLHPSDVGHAGSTQSYATPHWGHGPLLVRVTLKKADIFRRFATIHFLKMNPYAEVYLAGQSIGSVPPAAGGDMEPTWNYRFEPQECEIGDDLHIRVFDKHSWPRKDVLIGKGTIRFTMELVAAERIGVDQSIRLFKKHEGEKPEHTGNVVVELKFIRGPESSDLQLADTFSAASQGSGIQLGQDTHQIPHLPLVIDRPNPIPVMDSISFMSGGNRLMDRHDLDLAPQERRHQLVVSHYWEREVVPQRRKPVFCTAAILHIFRRWRWLRALCCCGATATGAGVRVGASPDS